jgi:hypothetical protein
MLATSREALGVPGEILGVTFDGAGIDPFDESTHAGSEATCTVSRTATA